MRIKQAIWLLVKRLFTKGNLRITTIVADDEGMYIEPNTMLMDVLIVNEQQRIEQVVSFVNRDEFMPEPINNKPNLKLVD